MVSYILSFEDQVSRKYHLGQTTFTQLLPWWSPGSTLVVTNRQRLARRRGVNWGSEGNSLQFSATSRAKFGVVLALPNFGESLGTLNTHFARQASNRPDTLSVA